MLLGGYEERAERIRELVLEAMGYVREACRSSCARSSCDRVEDSLAAAMDEAEEAARLPGPWLRLPSLAAAARRLEEEAERLEALGCREEASLFREAAQRLYMADTLA